MTTETIAALITVGALVYTTMAGFTWQLAGAHWDDPGPLLIGVAWPIMLPAILGTKIAKRLEERRSGIPKAKVRQ